MAIPNSIPCSLPMVIYTAGMMRYRRNSPRLLNLIGLAMLIVTLAGCGSSAHLAQSIPAATLAPYPGNGDPPLLVDVAWLQERIAAGPAQLIILDASTLSNYRAGHIPGAVHAWWQDTMDPNSRVYGTVLKPDTNALDPQLLRRNFIEDLGVSRETDVVVYDDAQNRWAARIVWTLSFLGYGKASVLDGGLGAWRGAGGALQQSENDPAPISQPPIDPQKGWYLTKEEVLPLLSDPNVTVVDVRTDAERTDDIDETITPGSIPGSVMIPWTAAISDESGHLLPPDKLRALFEQAGITPDRTIVLYARFGVEAAHTWLALKLLGYPKVLVFDGGWVDWAQDPATPKEPVSSPAT
jgi:thiosulfate/3-mercaptopyruvate sulfurtransferase